MFNFASLLFEIMKPVGLLNKIITKTDKRKKQQIRIYADSIRNK